LQQRRIDRARRIGVDDTGDPTHAQAASARGLEVRRAPLMG
jgi:hypothetical protein